MYDSCKLLSKVFEIRRQYLQWKAIGLGIVLSEDRFVECQWKLMWWIVFNYKLEKIQIRDIVSFYNSRGFLTIKVVKFCNIEATKPGANIMLQQPLDILSMLSDSDVLQALERRWTIQAE